MQKTKSNHAENGEQLRRKLKSSLLTIVSNHKFSVLTIISCGYFLALRKISGDSVLLFNPKQNHKFYIGIRYKTRCNLIVICV